MAARNSAAAAAADRELTITRVFDAPVTLVFKVWTDPEHLARWWGARDWTTSSLKADIRPGGGYRVCIRSPKGEEHWMSGVYREIVALKRIVFTFAWEDAAGKPGHETLVTVTFAEQDGKTALTFHQAIFETMSARDDHQKGWNSFMDRLTAYLAKQAGSAAR
jgi:uncharacterized protein YndB with AHSA1/START domain